MGISYKKLWHLLLDRDMKKGDLQRLTGMSATTLSKLSKNEPVNMAILVRICEALGCNIGDIVDANPQSPQATIDKKRNVQ